MHEDFTRAVNLEELVPGTMCREDAWLRYALGTQVIIRTVETFVSYTDHLSITHVTNNVPMHKRFRWSLTLTPRSARGTRFRGDLGPCIVVSILVAWYIDGEEMMRDFMQVPLRGRGNAA